MTDLAQHIHELLTAALPPGTPVLLPEQAESALGGRKPGQAGGISGYLQAHPGGYVQIEAPVPITSTGNQDTYWTAVGALAPTPAAADALAAQVRLALTGTPPADPGWFTTAIPPQTSPLGPDAHLTRATYARTLLLGQVPR